MGLAGLAGLGWNAALCAGTAVMRETQLPFFRDRDHSSDAKPRRMASSARGRTACASPASVRAEDYPNRDFQVATASAGACGTAPKVCPMRATPAPHAPTEVSAPVTRPVTRAKVLRVLLETSW